MKQTEKQKLIAAAMEKEKSKLFCYACYRLGDEKDAEDILQDIFIWGLRLEVLMYLV